MRPSSIDIKDPDTNRLSLAHFYRQCSIWPGLSLQELLVPSTRPLVSTAISSVPQGGSCGKLRLAARVPRPSYFAGQSCYVHIQIANNTQRTVRSLCMTLVRTMTIYRPWAGRRNHGGKTDEHITNKYVVKTVVDEISESRLVMADRTTRRAASSRGWWTGVNPDEKTAFTHCILVPVRLYSGSNFGPTGSPRATSARCPISCALQTPRRRPCHPRYCIRFCGHVGTDHALVRYVTYPHCFHAFCRSSHLPSQSR